MRLLFVADLHYALKQFDWLTANASKYDLLIIGGDLLELGSALDIDVQIVVMEKYLHRLRQLVPLVVCSGNHDGDRRNEANESVAHWLTEAKAPQLFVDGDSVVLDDTLITVCAWWDGPVSRAQLEAQFALDAAKRKSKWIWIHHAPPDRTSVSWTGRKFGGDEFLVEWISRYQPDMVLSGHIHNAPFYDGGSWIDRLGKTWIFNPGRQIGPCPTCLSIDLDKMAASWVSLEREDSRELSVVEQNEKENDVTGSAIASAVA
jgi:Icc-related predicted phosphoesterase